MALSFTSDARPPSNTQLLPNRFLRPAFGELYGFDADADSGVTIDGALTTELAEPLTAENGDILVFEPASGGTPAPQPLVNNFSGNFDGTNDAVNCGALSAYQGATSMSLSVWFKSDVAGVGPDVGMSQDFNHQFGFTSYSTTANYVLVNETNNDNLYGQYTPPNDTNWHHYLMTFSSGTLLLYIDGSLVTFTSVVDQGPSTLPNVTSDFFIGHGDGTNYADGLIDEVALWTVALDSSNVTALYNSNAPTVLTSNAGNYSESSNLTHWWRLGDNASDTSSGGGAVALGNVIGNVENEANSGTNDGTGSGAAYATDVPS